MLVDSHKNFTVKSYIDLYKMYKDGDIANAYSQTLPEGEEVDFTEDTDLIKIRKLLIKDPSIIYLIQEIDGAFLITMVEMSIGIDLKEDFNKGEKLFIGYGESGVETECFREGEEQFFHTYDYEISLLNKVHY